MADSSRIDQISFQDTLLKAGLRLGKFGGWAITPYPDKVLHWSKELFSILEVPGEITPSFEDGLKFFVPRYAEIVNKAVDNALNLGTPFEIEVEMLTLQNRRLWVRITGEAVRDSDGSIVRLEGCLQDTTEHTKNFTTLKRINNLLAAQQKVNLQIPSFDNPRQLFTEVCHMAATIGQIPLVWVVALDEGVLLPETLQAAGVHQELASEIVDVWAQQGFPCELHRVLCDQALHVCPDIRVDELSLPWRDQALARGFESYSILPLHARGKLHSIMVYFASGATFFNETLIELLGSVSKNRSLSLENVLVAQDKSRTISRLKLLETCIERLNDMVVVTDVASIDAGGPFVVYVNEAFVKQTGYCREEVIGRSPRLLQGPLTQKDVLARIRERVRNWLPVREDLINYKKSGEFYWVELDMVPVADETGRYVQWVAVERDITERKAGEVALNNSLNRFKSLAQVTNDCIWDWDLRTDEIWWNEGMETLFGYSRTDLERDSRSWINRIHPDDRERIVNSIHCVIDSNENAWQGEYRFAHADGRWIEVLDRGQVIRDQSGAPAYMVGGMKDLTVHIEARRQSMAQLSKMNLLHRITRAVGNRQNLQSIYEIVIASLESELPVDFCVMASYSENQGKVVIKAFGDRSKELAAKLGFQVDRPLQIVGRYLKKVLQGGWVYLPDLSAADSTLGQRMSEFGQIESLVITPLLRGEQVFGLIACGRRGKSSFTNEETAFLLQLSEHVALALDQAELFAELKLSNQNLRRTQKLVLQQERLRALAEMAGGIAHDINNAISPVALYTEALLTTEPGLSDRALRQLKTIQLAIDDVANTVTRMGKFARNSASDDLVVAELNQICLDAIELTRARWENISRKNGLSIEVKPFLADGLPSIPIVESEMREVVTNLIFNAIDALPNGGEITVSTALINEGGSSNLILSVADNGTGMSAETVQRCIEPFYTTKGERGTGLGLSMVYGIVQRMNGELRIHSREGQGSKVDLVFPVLEENSFSPASTITETSVDSAFDIRVLLVDDDSRVLTACSDVLVSKGYLVDAVSSGESALRELRSGLKKFDLLITDFGMPEMDGRELAKQVKISHPNLPVVMLTGWGKQMSLEDETLVDIDGLLSKPLKLKELASLVSQLVTR